MDAEQIGNRLRELRAGAGLSQLELARKAGLGQRTISHIEQGVNSPLFLTVVALADALGVPIEAFREPPSAEVDKPHGRPKKK